MLKTGSFFTSHLIFKRKTTSNKATSFNSEEVTEISVEGKTDDLKEEGKEEEEEKEDDETSGSEE